MIVKFGFLHGILKFLKVKDANKNFLWDWLGSIWQKISDEKDSRNMVKSTKNFFLKYANKE